MCALFRRTKREDEPSATGPALPDPPAPDPAPAEAALPALPVPEPPAPPGIDFENSLKELAARMTVLSSTLETVHETRSEMETKLRGVEERLVRLGALAEAVSSQYNPFIARDSPAEPSWEPGSEGAGPAVPPEPAPPGHGPAPAEAHGSPASPQAPGPASGPASALAPPAALVAPPETAGRAADDPVFGALRFELGPPQGTAPAAADPFEENMLLLEWVGLMLRHVGRAGLLDVLEYYEALRWLDEPTKARVVRIAVGVDAPDRAGNGHWRGDLDLHARSLVAISRLQGRTVTPARLEAIRLDLGRLFGR